MMGTEEIGCCGAYCKTCREFQNTCKGCKLGYSDSSRDLSRAKCKIKKCCLIKEHSTCADCKEYDDCEIIQTFIQHPGYKYIKYKQALEFIRARDYAAFLQVAESRKNVYGKSPKQLL